MGCSESPLLQVRMNISAIHNVMMVERNKNNVIHVVILQDNATAIGERVVIGHHSKADL